MINLRIGKNLTQRKVRHIGITVKDEVVALSGHVPTYGENGGAEMLLSIFLACASLWKKCRWIYLVVTSG